MSPPSISSTILSVLEEREPETTTSVGEIVESVQRRLDERDRVPAANEIRGRLTRLTREGILERPERGRYALVRTDPEKTENLARLVDIVSERARPEMLRRTVLWDATPYLRLAEDGGPGTRLVVEHENAGSLRDEVEVAWPDDGSIATWQTGTTGPLGTRLWEPDGPAPYRTRAAVVFVEREKFGATGLTHDGYRAPTPERILVEFLGDDGPPEAAPIVRNILGDPSVSFERLWAAGETLGATVEVGALLAGLGTELRPELRDEFLGTISPVAGTLVRGRR